MAERLTIGRRVGTRDEIELPGDYRGPIPFQTSFEGAVEACWFFPPVDEHHAHGDRGLHGVHFPPHTYRECDDGSLEIRASILCGPTRAPYWHGFLDEGHVWREIDV